MKRLFFAVFSVLFLFLPLWVSATGQAAAVSDKLTITTMEAVSTNKRYPYWAEVAGEKFGVEFDFQRMSDQGVNDALALRFAAGDYFDWFWNYGSYPYPPETTTHKWGMDGHLVALNDYLDDIPNYVKLWSAQSEVKLWAPRTPEQWQESYAHAVAADGNLYFIPAISQQLTTNGWMYRKDVFDDLGLDYPRTPDELYDVLAALKRAYPDVYPLVPRGLGRFIFNFFLAWRTYPSVHFDIDSGEMVYGPATEKYREMMTFVKKIIDAGFVHPEWPTFNWAQYIVLVFTEGKGGFVYPDPYADSAVGWTGFSQRYQPGSTSVWETPDWMVTAYPERGMMINRMLGHYPFGPFITKGASSDKIDRLMQTINWLCTAEGELAINFGEQGVTWEYGDDGKPHQLDFIRSFYNQDARDARDEWSLGGHPLYRSYAEKIEGQGDVVLGALAHAVALLENCDSLENIRWDFSVPESKDIADLGVVVKDTYTAYQYKFLLGELDVTSDADWTGYLDALKRAGLDQYIGIHRTAYDRK